MFQFPRHPLSYLILAIGLSACATPQPRDGLRAHLARQAVQAQTTADIPPIVDLAYPRLTRQSLPSSPTFSIAVDDVPVRELLTALARDADAGLEMHPDVTGRISLHVKDQTLPRLLKRIARQSGLRIEWEEGLINAEPDTPTLRIYPLDYVNMSRQMSATVATTTQVSNGQTSTAANSGQSQNPQGDSAANLRIENRTRHHFWENIEKNVRDLLRETDKALPNGSTETHVEQELNQQGIFPTTPRQAPMRKGSGNSLPPPAIMPFSHQQQGSTHVRNSNFQEASHVILNTETGLLTVRATQRQHERIQSFLDQTLSAARRQVMIEATIVEVELSEGYRHGIDWSRLRTDGSGFALTRPANGSLSDSAGSAFNLVLRQLDSPLNLVAAIDLLQSFGTTKVLSSPRLSVLNNQTALLKVVENIVFFNVKADTTTSATTGTTTAVTTTPQSVSVGLIMSVTPQVSETGSVMLNIRPSISSVSDWKQDPNPSNKVANFVPQIRTREIESVMRIRHGDIAVLGGLMEDGVAYHTGRIPALGSVPLAGELLTKRDNVARKSELVIFLRPTVIHEPGQTGRLPATSPGLPDEDFFNLPAHASPLGISRRF